MFGANFLRYCFMAAGVLLLLPAVASFTVGGPGSCRRLCWVHDLAAHFVSAGTANIVSGGIWLALAVAFFVVGVRMKGEKRAV
jgi:hypothetical protein